MKAVCGVHTLKKKLKDTNKENHSLNLARLLFWRASVMWILRQRKAAKLSIIY